MTLYRILWNHAEPPKPFSEEVRAYREHLGMEFGTLVPVEPDEKLQTIKDLWESEFKYCKRYKHSDGLCVQCVEVLDAALKEGT